MIQKRTIHPNSIKKQFKKGHFSIFKGVPMKEETKRNLSLAKIGHKVSKEQALKQSNSMKGRRLSPETEFKKGVIPWNKGTRGLYTASEEKRQKHREARLRQVFPTRNSKPEKIMQIALALNGINFETHVKLVGQPDIFINPNICIFVDGDFWHANPTNWKENDIILKKPKLILAKDIWIKDSRITNKLTDSGYKVIRIWQSRIEENVQLCIEDIIKLNKNIGN